MSAAVDHPNDHDGVGQNPVENSIRKTLDEHAPDISVQRRVCERCAPNALDRIVQLSSEDGAKPRLLLLVPAEDLEGFGTRFGEEDNAAHGSPVLISARTSSQETPTGP